MISNLTELSAGVTSLFYIPQCSGASSSLQLSDKTNYPYFFRTVGNVVAFGEALMEWIRQMNWSMFALVYTDDNVGQQSNIYVYIYRKKEKIYLLYRFFFV